MTKDEGLEQLKQIVEIEKNHSDEITRRMAQIFLERECNCKVRIFEDLELVDETSEYKVFRILSTSSIDQSVVGREILVKIDGSVDFKIRGGST